MKKRVGSTMVGLVVLGCQALAWDAVAASTADLALTSDMASLDLTQLEEPRGKLWSVGIARNDDNDALTAGITFNAVGNLKPAPRVRAGVGWKLSYHNTFQSSYSLALGGSFRYEPAGVRGVGVEGQAYIAPDVLSTNDAERYQEFMLRATYDLHARATVFGGWVTKTVRYHSDAANNKVDIADGLMAGFSLAF